MTLPNDRPAVQSYSKLANTYDAIRFVGNVNELKENYRRDAILSLLPAHKGKALDVACGTGRGLLLLRERADKTFGIDGTIQMLHEAVRKLADRQAPARVCNANAAALPFATGSFDIVTCLNFLHLFDDPVAKKAFIAEIGRVLKPGGTAVIEFDNATHGLFLGPVRKYFGKDIGYEWPWALRGYFGPEFVVKQARGTNLPFIWRIPVLRRLESFTALFPINYLSSRLLVQAVKVAQPVLHMAA